MPKTKISEYSTTNSANTDIEGINIDEGCAPSGINNAIRELMVHLKEFQTGASGDAFTFAGGTLMSGTNTISGAAVISGNINSSGTTNTFSGGNILSGTNTISGSAIISGNINSSGTTNTFSGGNIFSGTNTFSGTNVFSSDVTLNAQKDLRFADSDSSNWVAFQAPATVASNVTWTLPAADGTSNQVLATNGSGTLSWATAGGGASISAGDSKVEVTDTGSNGTIVFNTDNAERMRVGSSGYVGIGTTSPGSPLSVLSSVATAQGIYRNTDVSVAGAAGVTLELGALVGTTPTPAAQIVTVLDDANAGNIRFGTRSSGTVTERARIDSSGNFLVGQTTVDSSTAGASLRSTGQIVATASAIAPLYVNRLTSDGDLVQLAQASTVEGTISVSGSTVSYNGGHLSRWAQMPGTKDDTLVKGTVMSNLDEMNVYVKPTLYWTEDDELPMDEEGNPTVAVGDVKQETSVSENEQLNKVKVSDVEGDVNVAGVFVNWTYDEAHQVDEINMAMTGDMIIRVAQGVVVQKGDLLMSAGDGTAKPQGDDIVRSKTVAKVTSNHVTCTYADGSYCVPCVLMAC